MLMAITIAQADAANDVVNTISRSEAANPTVWAMYGLSFLLAIICVLLHNFVLRLVWHRVHLRGSFGLRYTMVLTVLILLLGHLVQIVLFAATYYVLAERFAIGYIDGAHDLVRDYVYFSGVTYTTVGFGDLTPKDSLRPLAASEALVGFVMITWSASFTFLQMQRSWKEPDDVEGKPDEDQDDDAHAAGANAEGDEEARR